MIIDELLADIKNKSHLETLKSICTKMQTEHEYKNEAFDNVEILYYHKYYENKFYEYILTLSFDMLDENSYFVDKWEFIKDKNEYPKKVKSIKLKRGNTPKGVLVEFAKILKGLTNDK
jgi:hypothetical protein